MVSTTTEKFEKPIVVQKYGGSCLSSTDDIEFAAHRISETYSQGYHVIVVVSAMAGTTNDLISLAHKITKTPPRREMDMLISAGERISMSLMAMALQKRNLPAISFTGSQAGILTDTSHSDAEIIDIKPIRVVEALKQNKVVVIAGFQGVNPSTKEVTTLGRGGTDLTAVAFASHFKAQECQFLKDVDGVYNCDPKIFKKVLPLSTIDTKSFYQASLWGAGILQSRALKLALDHNLDLRLGHFKKKDFSTLVSQSSPKNYPLLISCRKNIFVFKPSANTENHLTKISESLVARDLHPPQILYEGEKGLILAAYDEYLTEYKDIFELEKIDFDLLSSITLIWPQPTSHIETLKKEVPRLIGFKDCISLPNSYTVICSSDELDKFKFRFEVLF